MASEILHRRGLNPAEVDKATYDAALAEAKVITEEDHERVVAASGLHIIGTERHDSRRIDNQLRGRAGRQGDPGSSRFYLSLEDDLMKRFASERVAGLMERLGLEDDVAIESRIVSKTIESAQTRVEGYNYDIRKRVVEFDDALPDVEVVALDPRLGAFDGLADDARFDRDVVLQPQPLHQARYPLGGEALHEVVFEREVEARRAGVALAPGAAAELVIDPARVVALGADDVEPARGHH